MRALTVQPMHKGSLAITDMPDPVPADGEFDMCRNGQYTERGIKEIHGFGSEQWTVESAYAVKLDPALGDFGVLMEPTSVVAKAWEQLERIGARAWFEPRKALVTGAGPISSRPPRTSGRPPIDHVPFPVLWHGNRHMIMKLRGSAFVEPVAAPGSPLRTPASARPRLRKPRGARSRGWSRTGRRWTAPRP